MAAETKEQKEAAAEEKRVAEQTEKDAEAARLAAASVSAADATAKATAEAREQEQLKDKAEREETAEDGGDDGEFAGKVYSSENFSITTSTPNAGTSIEIRPAGWVGPGTFVAASRVKELAELLGKVKNLPKE